MGNEECVYVRGRFRGMGGRIETGKKSLCVYGREDEDERKKEWDVYVGGVCSI